MFIDPANVAGLYQWCNKYGKNQKSYYTENKHYIKNEKDLEKYILNSNGTGVKKLKKSELEKFINEERQKLNIQRFKGLGEMNPEELWETTLDPQNRTLLRVEYSKGTKEKSREDQKMIEILMGDEVAPRKDFITSNALEVTTLDI